ncbi:MAG: glycerophosphodiester phosphodiesterase family protein [bacterium]|nr:glycerophosphodiester phosphodiesterase family protein [bacterium]
MKPLVIAHRGDVANAPENTQIAFELAIELGVDLVELDVNRTRDGIPVIFHGPSLEKYTGLQTSIHDVTWEEAQQLDIGAWKDEKFTGQHMLSLPEVLTLARDRVNLAIDLKTFDIIPDIVSCIQTAGMDEQDLICGCNASQVHAYDPNLAVGLNMDAEMETLAKQPDPLPFYHAYIRQAVQNGLTPLNMNYRHITPELLHLARLKALSVWAWTVDDPETMRQMIDLGVNAIYTNFPKRLLDILI